MQAQVLRSTLLRSGHEDACATIKRPLQIALTAAVLAVLITPNPSDLACHSLPICSDLSGMSPSDPLWARRAGVVAGVGHLSVDSVMAFGHLGHPLQLP